MQLNSVDHRSIQCLTGDAEMMCIRLQIEVVRWCRIRGGGEVVGLGRDIEVLIAARSSEEIERPLSVRLPRADLTPPLGVDVTRDNEVDAARIE